MNKRIKNLIFIGIFSLLLITAFLYFFVSGKTVENMFSEYENYDVTIIKSSSLGVIDSETVLTSKQKEMLKNLFRETSFRRVIGDTVYTTDLTRYTININTSIDEVYQARNGETIAGVLFSADSMGGEYFSISGEFNEKHLKIYNKQWNVRIDEIITRLLRI